MIFLHNIKKFKLKLLSIMITIPFITLNLSAHTKITIDEFNHIKDFLAGIEYFIKIYKPYKTVVQPNVLQNNLINFGETGYGSYNAVGGAQLLVESRYYSDMIIPVQSIIDGINLTEDELLKIRVAANDIIKSSEKILSFLYEVNDSRKSSDLYKYLVVENSISSQILYRLKKKNSSIDDLIESKNATSIKHVDAINTLNKQIDMLYKDLILKLESLLGPASTMERLTEFLDFSETCISKNNTLEKNNIVDCQNIKKETLQEISGSERIKGNQATNVLFYPDNASSSYIFTDNNDNSPVSGDNFGDNYNQGAVWFNSNYLHYTADMNNGAKFRQKSVILGFSGEHQANDFLSLGIFYNNISSNLIKEYDTGLDYNIKSHQLGSYTTILYNNNMFIDGQFNYIKNKLKGKSDTDSYKNNMRLINANIGVGIHFSLDSQWYIKPKSCIDFSHYKYDNNSTIAEMDNQDYQSVKISAECEIGGTMILAGYLLKPKVDFGVTRKLKDNTDKILFKFTGKDSEIIGDNINKSTFKLGLGTDITSGDFNLNVNYKLSLSNNSKAQAATITLGYIF